MYNPCTPSSYGSVAKNELVGLILSKQSIVYQLEAPEKNIFVTRIPQKGALKIIVPLSILHKALILTNFATHDFSLSSNFASSKDLL